jgi:hypothetical protein
MSVKSRSHDRDAVQDTCRDKCTKTLTKAAESIAKCLVLLHPETSPSPSETLSFIQDVVLLLPSDYSSPSRTMVSSFLDVVLLLSRRCFSLLRGLAGWRVQHGRGWASIRGYRSRRQRRGTAGKGLDDSPCGTVLEDTCCRQDQHFDAK